MNHANKHKVTQISMPKAGCGLDRIEWHKVERLIKEICAHSKSTITVYDQNKAEKSQKRDETSVRSTLGQAQRQDEALSKLIEWIERGKNAHITRIPRTTEACMATQQPTEKLTTPRRKFVPKVWNRRQ